MLASSRLDFITKLITEQKFITVEELSQEFNVSGETIRRDLKTLEKKGILKRTYGGAFLEGAKDNDVNVQVRKDKMVKNKDMIAEICSQFLHPDDTIFLDSSTTALEIAKKITDIPITVITNSLIIINHLSNYRNVRVISLGGVLDIVNMCFTGKTTVNEMKNYYAKKGFISCRSISMKYGVMDSNEQIGQVRSVAMENCNKCYLIADHTKFDNTALCKISNISDFEAVITDIAPNDKWMEYFERYHISVFFPS